LVWLVCFWFARFRFLAVIGRNGCRHASEAGVCRPFLPQIKSSKPKSTVDLVDRTVDLRLGLVWFEVMGRGKWTVEEQKAGVDKNKQSFFPRTLE
jgi:hypothetical protein